MIRKVKYVLFPLRLIIDIFIALLFRLDEERKDRVCQRLLSIFALFLPKKYGHIHEALKKNRTRQVMEILFEALIKSEPGRPLTLNYPLLISLDVNNYCIAKCKNCISYHRREGIKQIPDRMIDGICNVPTPYVFLTGGEPLISETIEVVCKKIVESGKLVVLATNIYNNKLHSIYQEHRKNVTFLLSIYGNKEIHTKYRGEESYQALIDSMNYFSRKDASLFINCVITDNDYSSINELYRLFRDTQISFERVYVTKYVDCRNNACSFDKKDISKSLLSVCKKLSEATKSAVFLQMTRKNNFLINIILKYLLLITTGIRMERNVCGAGKWYMHINADGSVLPCHVGKLSNAIESNSFDIQDAWFAIRDVVLTDVSNQRCPLFNCEIDESRAKVA